MNRELTSFDYRRVIDTIRRANAIAANNDLDALLDQMLELFVEVASADAGTLYLYDTNSDELIFKVVKGDPKSQVLVGTRFPSTRGWEARAYQRLTVWVAFDDLEDQLASFGIV